MTEHREKRPDQIAQGIMIILASVVAMAFADAVVKLVSSNLTLWQVFAARSLFAVPCLIVLGHVRQVPFGAVFDPWVLLRSGLLVMTWLAFYASLPVLDLSVAAVAVYTNPILTALLCALVLGERVSGRQWLGVLVGFAGVAAILRPGTDAFTWLVGLPLLGAALYSAAMVLTRTKCQHNDAVNLALGLHGSFIVTGLGATAVLAVLDLEAETVAAYPFLLGTWTPMGSAEWALMAFLGVLSAAFFLGVARAYQIAPPQIIGTFDYAYLVSAALWGFIFFAEQPDALTLLGMALITSAGLLVAERRAEPLEGRECVERTPSSGELTESPGKPGRARPPR
ncbi:MAG: DMT family transporter [Pseudomonadota bacterium]